MSANPAEILGRINVARGQVFLPSLRWDPKLATMAQAQASRMAADGRIESGDYDARLQAVYPNHSGGEAVASGPGTAEQIVAAWTAPYSQDRITILGPATAAGIAVATATDGTAYYAADLARL